MSRPRAALAVIVLSLVPQISLGQARIPAPERVLFDLANQARSAAGLPPLKWNGALASAARRHASRMAERNTLSHQLPGEPGLPDRAARAGARFSTLAENVAEGPSPESIHEQWMKSAHHRENLLDPQLDSAGIAVAERNGVLFAVEDFSRDARELSLQQQSKLVEAQLRSRGLRIRTYPREARQTCALDNGYAGTYRPSLVVHYFTTDPATLPKMLEDRVRTGRYRFAAVGACPPGTKFAGYRIAVMMYE
jgi:Cysteine-rich secretory protein family